MNGNIPWSKAGRNLLVFFISFSVLYAILNLGIGVGPFGEEDLGVGIRTYLEFRSLRIPADWVVPPFIFVSSILIAWLDSRRMERMEAERTCVGSE